MSVKPKIIVILGPTAVGKSDLAVVLARKYNGEVISADSRQVYGGLDIGTGKITVEEMQGVPHHLLDVADPQTVFTVEHYKKLAQKAIIDIVKRGKVPIICGGTGFYIHYLIDDVSIVDVPPNKALRTELSKKSVEALFEMLEDLDPDRAENIDRQNPVRLIRAIEIATELGKVPKVETNAPYEVLQIGIDAPDDLLKEKIKIRLEKRLASGMVAEVEGLIAKGVSFERLFSLGLEYRYVSQYLKKEITEAEMKERLFFAIWHYVKRQRAWFKRDKRIVWCSLVDMKLIEETMGKFLGL
ncbi:MAG: tRNA delta(2)-isopentenylpyrophosphate transferase, tRNA dimethylallyltransferase [Candidatus Parcubacteria bacterium]|jgi:tRNA dimethylallyltransferase